MDQEPIYRDPRETGNSEEIEQRETPFRTGISAIRASMSGSASIAFGLYMADLTPPSALLSTPTTSELLVLFRLFIMSGPSYGDCWLSLLEIDDILLHVSHRSVLQPYGLSRAWPLSKTLALTSLGTWTTNPAERTLYHSTKRQKSWR